MESCQGRERAASWRACHSFWWAPPFFPPLFLALGLFPFTLSHCFFCSGVSWSPMSTVLPQAHPFQPSPEHPHQPPHFHWALFPAGQTGLFSNSALRKAAYDSQRLFFNLKLFFDFESTQIAHHFWLHRFVLTLFIFKTPNYVLARTLTERVV